MYVFYRIYSARPALTVNLVKSSFTKEEGLTLPEEELIAQMGYVSFHFPAI